MLARPHPGPLPEEREKHSPVLWLNNRAWLSCASETKDKEAGTAIVTSEFSSTVPTLSLSSGERVGVRASVAAFQIPQPFTVCDPLETAKNILLKPRVHQT